MAVDTFDPGALGNPMDEGLVAALCAVAEAHSGDTLSLEPADVARFAVLASHPDWSTHAPQLTDLTLLGLIRVFTLGEMQYASWAAGDKSPVVPLVKELKRRGSYPSELTQWIKAHTDNKFLPHGSLLDRL